MMKITNKPNESAAKANVPKAPAPVASPQVVDEMEDTWVFEGKSYKAQEMQMPAPLAAAFKPSTGQLPSSPPYAYDRAKFSVHGVASTDGSFHVGVSLTGGDYIAAVTPLNDDFKIELVNAKNGKFLVTKEELLKVVHAAKLDIESSHNLV